MPPRVNRGSLHLRSAIRIDAMVSVKLRNDQHFGTHWDKTVVPSIHGSEEWALGLQYYRRNGDRDRDLFWTAAE